MTTNYLHLSDQEMEHVLAALLFYSRQFAQTGSKEIRQSMQRIAARIRKKK